MRDLLAPLTDRLAPHLWALAVANLVANIGIVVTGGAVRLTGSGLGCPTWPRCTDASYVAHGELGLHGAIEFGNRLLTFLLAATAIATVLVVFRSTRRDLRTLAALGEATRAALVDAAVDGRSLLVLVAWAAVGTVLTARTFKWE